MLWFNLFQNLQKEEIRFIWKPTWKGNQKTNAFYKLKKKKSYERKKSYEPNSPRN